MIQTALDLFHQQGVNATSVDEILEKSGTGKSQFYHYFKSKEGLVHAVLEFFYEALKTDRLPVSHKIESWEDLENFFRFFLEHQKKTGCSRSCPIGTIANELENSDELIRQDIKLIFEFTRKALSQFFYGLKAKGELKASVDPDSLADFAFSIVQGGLLVSKAKKDSEPFENSVTHAMTYLKSLAQ